MQNGNSSGTTDSCPIVCTINAKFAKPCGNRNKKARIGGEERTSRRSERGLL